MPSRQYFILLDQTGFTLYKIPLLRPSMKTRTFSKSTFQELSNDVHDVHVAFKLSRQRPKTKKARGSKGSFARLKTTKNLPYGISAKTAQTRAVPMMVKIGNFWRKLAIFFTPSFSTPPCQLPCLL